MKDWSLTKKIVVALVVLILLALVVTGIMKYFDDKKKSDQTRVANRIMQVVQDKKALDDITGDELTKAIRANLANQPVSSIGINFYQPQSNS